MLIKVMACPLTGRYSAGGDETYIFGPSTAPSGRTGESGNKRLIAVSKGRHLSGLLYY